MSLFPRSWEAYAKFANTDKRTGAVAVDLQDYPEISSFPDALRANTQIELAHRRKQNAQSSKARNSWLLQLWAYAVHCSLRRTFAER